jgi:hypothetical protein
LSLIVERQDPARNGWIRIAGPMTSPNATDNNVPSSASLGYRISYTAADGRVGPASTVVTVSTPVQHLQPAPSP